MAAAATSVFQFMKNIESQMQWLLQLPAHATHRLNGISNSARVLRQVPAITEIARIDAEGREQVRVSRTKVDVIGGQADLSQDPKFLQAMTVKRYASPVYFRHDSEPYMTLALAGMRKNYGVVAAEVNLKFMSDVVSDIQPAVQGMIFVIDTNGRLVAHPNISLVLRNTDLSHLEYVRAALARSPSSVGDVVLYNGSADKHALTMYAPIPSFGWTLILYQPKHPGSYSNRPFCVDADRVPFSKAPPQRVKSNDPPRTGRESHNIGCLSEKLICWSLNLGRSKKALLLRLRAA